MTARTNARDPRPRAEGPARRACAAHGADRACGGVQWRRRRRSRRESVRPCASVTGCPLSRQDARDQAPVFRVSATCSARHRAGGHVRMRPAGQPLGIERRAGLEHHRRLHRFVAADDPQAAQVLVHKPRRFGGSMMATGMGIPACMPTPGTIGAEASRTFPSPMPSLSSMQAQARGVERWVGMRPLPCPVDPELQGRTHGRSGPCTALGVSCRGSCPGPGGAGCGRRRGGSPLANGRDGGRFVALPRRSCRHRRQGAVR